MSSKTAPEVWAYVSSRDYLQAYDLWARTHLRGYSRRSLALRAKVASPNFVGLVLSGKRPFSEKWIKGFARAIRLSDEALNYLLKLSELDSTKEHATRTLLKELIAAQQNAQVTSLAGDQLRLIQNPIAWTLYHMIDLADQEPRPIWFKKRLIQKLDAAEISKSLQLLRSLKLIKLDASSDKLVSLKSKLESSDQLKKMENANYHAFVLREAQTFLEDQDPSLRSFGSLTITLNASDAAKIKEEIQSFGKKLLSKYASTSKVEGNLFRMNIQFYPLTQSTAEKDKS